MTNAALETSRHFLLECMAYDVPCQWLLLDLHNILPANIIVNKDELCRVMISGTNDLNTRENRMILTRVCELIDETGRIWVICIHIFYPHKNYIGYIYMHKNDYVSMRNSIHMCNDLLFFN